MGLPPIRVNTISQPHVIFYPHKNEENQIVAFDSASRMFVLLLDNRVFGDDFDQTHKNGIEIGIFYTHKNEENRTFLFKMSKKLYVYSRQTKGICCTDKLKLFRKYFVVL